MKKLLVLGSNVGTLDIIRYAKRRGVHTIVADNLPVERSFGKQYADDNVLISTGDLDRLEDYIRKEGVSAVLAGISEFNLLNAMELCRRMGFPFYCSREQWDIVENKERFRALCERFDVPCPRTQYVGFLPDENVLQGVRVPVIVKPVDSSASIGITICRSREMLKEAVSLARDHSDVKRVIIEDFIEGQEFSAHYTISNGAAVLSCIDNRIPVRVHEGDVTSIPVARIYPSSFIEEYLEQVNPQLIRLCTSLGLDTGVLFVQGIHSETGGFHIFEAGLRCAGEAPYRILERVNGTSFMERLLAFALGEKAEDIDVGKEDPFLKGKHCCVTSFVSKGGRISQISGYDDITFKVPSIVDKECRYHVGDMTPSGDTLRQIVMRFVLVCNTQDQLMEDIETINHSIRILDGEGKDLCLFFDPRSYYSEMNR